MISFLLSTQAQTNSSRFISSRFIPKRCDCSAPYSHERDLIHFLWRRRRKTLSHPLQIQSKERIMQWRIKVGAHWDIDYVAGVARIHLTRYSIEIGVTSSTPCSLTN